MLMVDLYSRRDAYRDVIVTLASRTRESVYANRPLRVRGGV